MTPLAERAVYWIKKFESRPLREASMKKESKVVKKIAARVTKSIDAPTPPPLPKRIVAWWERPNGFWEFETEYGHKSADEIAREHAARGRVVRIIAIQRTKKS